MANWQISNPDFSREAVIAHFGDEGSHAEFYRMLRAVNRDLHLNCGYSGPGRRHWSAKSHLRLVDRLAKRLFRKGPRPIRLLDVGCGRGGPAIRAQEQWGADVTGMDISPYAIRRAVEETRKRAILEGLYFRSGGGMNIPYSDGEFPYVWAIETAAYIPDKIRFFSEIGRVLAPGGRFGMAAVAVDEHVAASSRFAFDCLARFLAAWDMASIESIESYADRMEASGMSVTRREDATAHTLRPHGKRLGRLVRHWDNRLVYRATAWYVRRKTNTDLDLMREQLEATFEAIESGVLRYGLVWGEKRGL
ncbi:MAG TPA: methyltransferase domain-containing protein [Rhodothermales bacterium]|nr:methyltransferase domain-containing protein [Rhodothermales bacterium]